MTFDNWLDSKKSKIVEERDFILRQLPANPGSIELAKALSRQYQSIYGVKNSFYRGIDNLPDDARSILLSSVRVRYIPDFATRPPNTITPAISIKDKEEELKLKLRHLFNKRNSFTHRLEQIQRLSSPAISMMPNSSKEGSSWYAVIEDYKLKYLSGHQDTIPDKKGGAYSYSFYEWPFALFEAVCGGIGVDFDRTSINLEFQDMLFSKGNKRVCWLQRVPHKELKDIKSLIEKYGPDSK